MESAGADKGGRGEEGGGTDLKDLGDVGHRGGLLVEVVADSQEHRPVTVNVNTKALDGLSIHLGSSVLFRSNFANQFLDRGVDGRGESKVNELGDLVVRRDADVPRLDVAMDDPLAVEEQKGSAKGGREEEKVSTSARAQGQPGKK